MTIVTKAEKESRDLNRIGGMVWGNESKVFYLLVQTDELKKYFVIPYKRAEFKY